MSKIGESWTELAPFIAGSLEFGYSKFGYYPLDEETIYPDEEQLVSLDTKKDISLSAIM